ncbi:MAG: spore coat protein U-like protein [Janthinobacterium sp.]|jgi:spore coat protein U-like protein
MTTSHKKHARHLLVLALALWSTNALAGFCSVSSSAMVFGAYQPIAFAGKLQSSNANSNATISVSCSGISSAASYTIGLGPSSQGPGNGISTRYLNNTAGGAPMAYNIYTDPNRMTVWGNNMNVLNGEIASGNSNLSHTVYGVIPAGQNTLMKGNYVDTLTITLTYAP